MSNWNPWKMTAIGMALAIATSLITGLVVANWSKPSQPSDSPSSQPSAAVPPPVAAPPPASGTAPSPAAVPAAAPHGRVRHIASNQAPHAPTPKAVDVDACNAYAKEQAGDKTVETVKDALVGAVAGAGVGAAGGAIAGGGKGAGKGAGIGGVVGAAAGTLYGLNEGRSHDARYVQAYRTCMKGHGYTG
jgi:hypothetical protein